MAICAELSTAEGCCTLSDSLTRSVMVPGELDVIDALPSSSGCTAGGVCSLELELAIVSVGSTSWSVSVVGHCISSAASVRGLTFQTATIA